MPLKWKLYYISSLYLSTWGILFLTWLSCIMFSSSIEMEISEWMFFVSTLFTAVTFMFKPFVNPQVIFKPAHKRKLFRLCFYMVLACCLLAMLPFIFILYFLFTEGQWEDSFWVDAPMLLANICIFYITIIERQALKHRPTHDDTSHSSISYTPGTPARPV